MSGREMFANYSILINIIVSFFRVMPNRVNVFVWNWIEGWRGICAIGLRYCLLKANIMFCGDNVCIGPYVEIKNWQKLKVGSNVSIHSHCYIDAIGEVEIGNDVSIAHSSSILSFNHCWDDPDIPIKYNTIELAKVRIHDDVWVGCGCRLLAGVTIGKRSVVAAGSVVTKKFPDGSIVGGVPAKILKEIANAE